MKCRFCQSELSDIFLDLGSAPPSNAFLDEARLQAPEVYFPLKLFTCSSCRLVQIDEVQSHDAIFDNDYVYFSSYSSSWLDHARRYVDEAATRLDLDTSSLVMEIASNDGYLLQYVKERGIPCVGVEPTGGTAEAARAKGVETIEEFFGQAFARRFVADRGKADLIVANNVFAHVPDVNDFSAGLAHALASDGTITIEFPHLMRLVTERQFDTVYHEHFSYFSLHTAAAILAARGLSVWDVQELSTHGGSLRLWVSHAGTKARTARVEGLLQREREAGMLERAYYSDFQHKADDVKNDCLQFLIEQRMAGKRVVAYGAAAKGNTLLNYAGVRPDLLSFVVDASPYKQGKWLPGSRIPVVDETRLRQERPDFIWILPWNLRQEIMAQLDYAREWGARFVVAVPRLEVM
jgi:SAM-dependent methyltransferase